MTNCDGLALGPAGRLPPWTVPRPRTCERPSSRFKLVGLGSARILGRQRGGLPDRARERGGAADSPRQSIDAEVAGRESALLRHGRPDHRPCRPSPARLAPDRRLVYLGEISYGIYLYHHIFFILWDDYAARHGLGTHVAFDLAKVGFEPGRRGALLALRRTADPGAQGSIPLSSGGRLRAGAGPAESCPGASGGELIRHGRTLSMSMRSAGSIVGLLPRPGGLGGGSTRSRRSGCSWSDMFRSM